MGTCLAVRLGAAAIVGYAVGGITGKPAVAWALAAAAVVGIYLWGRFAARRSGAACATGCGVTVGRRRRQAAHGADVAPEPELAPEPEPVTAPEPDPAVAGDRVPH